LTGKKSDDQTDIKEPKKATRKGSESSGNEPLIQVEGQAPTQKKSKETPDRDQGPPIPAGGKAGRPIWSGNLTIGLVNVPVRLHTMVRDKTFSFRLLHRDDGQPLRYERVCTREGKVIPWQDTVRGYEVRKGEYVVIEPEELKAFLPESDRKIRIEKFVYYLSLDPIYFETPYILTPDRSEDAYSLLVTALQELGRAAVGTITLRTKEYPVVVHVYQGGLVLTTLRYADEVTLPQTFGDLADLPGPKNAELALAKRIISDLSGDFAIADYRDTYRDSVEALVKKKIAGENVVYEKPHPEEAKELMKALKETIDVLARKKH
jgi:DNA end-binding protein Ku